MNCQSPSNRRPSKWPWITFAALLGAGAVAYTVAKKRAKKETGVDDLLFMCENVASRLESSLNGHAIAS